MANKEANILAAAKGAFAKAGYNGLRMSDVAKRAGVAEGTVYSYFSSKDDLIRALIGEYWTQLTRDARAAISGELATFERLRALAQFHIDGLIARYDYAQLTITLGRQADSAVSFTDEVRAFVRIFDEIFMAGQDRGDISIGADVWIARDMFYGSLEYSARTLILRGEGAEHTPPVVDNLLASFKAHYGLGGQGARAALHSPESLMQRGEALTDKLASLCEKLETVPR